MCGQLDQSGIRVFTIAVAISGEPVHGSEVNRLQSRPRDLRAGLGRWPIRSGKLEVAALPIPDEVKPFVIPNPKGDAGKPRRRGIREGGDGVKDTNRSCLEGQRHHCRVAGR